MPRTVTANVRTGIGRRTRIARTARACTRIARTALARARIARTALARTALARARIARTALARTALACALASSAPACLSSDSESHDDRLDPIPLLVLTDLGSPPLLAGIRAEGQPWTQIPFDGTGRFEIEIGGAYELFYVCEDGGVTWTQLVFSMTADGLSRTIGCTPIAGPAPSVTVTGQMLQPGRVDLGFGRALESATGPWTYAIDVPRGTHDLVAHDGDRVLAMRGLVIDDAMELAPIDLATGAELQKTRMRFTGVLGDELVSTRTLWLTENTLIALEFDGEIARELPDTILAPNDATLAIAAADSRYTHREAFLQTLPDVFFPPRLEGIELTDVTARWDTLPAGADAWFTVTAANVSVLAVATGRWLVARGVMRTEITMDGYRDEWRVPGTSTRRRELYVELGDGTRTSYGYEVLGSQ